MLRVSAGLLWDAAAEYYTQNQLRSGSTTRESDPNSAASSGASSRAMLPSLGLAAKSVKMRGEEGPLAPPLRSDSKATSHSNSITFTTDGARPTTTSTTAAVAAAGANSPNERLEDYSLLETLGEGAFGLVFLVSRCYPSRTEHNISK